jgi:hypothetical protein|eukprot:COSAG01_NODE_7833_length_3035_cov_1.938351_6_plen_46_part_00
MWTDSKTSSITSDDDRPASGAAADARFSCSSLSAKARVLACSQNG